MTKKILITGANGQLGHEMRNALKGNNRFECIFTDVAELDICNAEAVKQIIADNHIDYIVNCAAYTQVDKAEDNAELCKKTAEPVYLTKNGEGDLVVMDI